MKSYKNIAMWSGPRNLSTAMMRSFSQRQDCQAWDEPFYAAYLKSTGLDHPMREEIIAEGICSYADVAAECLRQPEADKTVYYQKHMTHHMIDGVDLSWIEQLTNVFLIRSPVRVLSSYAKKRGEVVASDLGYQTQRQLYDRVRTTAQARPIVIDSFDIRLNPEKALMVLCDALEIGFDDKMLRWPAGPAKEDGIWAKHWYDAIWNSTGFGDPEKQADPLPAHLQTIADQVRDDFEYLASHKIII